MGKLHLSIATIALAAALAACDSEAATAPPPTPTTVAPSTTAPAPSASPTPPVMPAAAKAHTEDGAVAFTRFAIDALNYALASLDTKPLEALASDYCTGCSSSVAGIKRISARRGAVSGGAWTVGKTRATSLRVPGAKPIAVAISVDTAPEVVTYPNGKKEAYTGGPARLRFILGRSTSSWEIVDWSALP